MSTLPSRNIGLDLVRATEVAAIAAGRWIGSGRVDKAHHAASQAMWRALQQTDMDGVIVIGEESRRQTPSPLDSGQRVGTGDGAAVDVIADPIDGTKLVVKGSSGAASLIAVAPRGTMWAPPPQATYMDKIVVDRDVAEALVPECMDAPAAWTLALVARIKDKPVRDLMVSLLNRPRHKDLIDEIRASGARIWLRSEGDAEAAIVAGTPGTIVDIWFGIGGVPEGVLAAGAVKAIGGAMLGRLAPQSAEERRALEEAGVDIKRILTQDDMVNSNEIFFAATGVTNSALLKAVRYEGRKILTDSYLVRSATRTHRAIQAEYYDYEVNDDE